MWKVPSFMQGTERVGTISRCVIGERVEVRENLRLFIGLESRNFHLVVAKTILVRSHSELGRHPQKQSLKQECDCFLVVSQRHAKYLKDICPFCFCTKLNGISRDLLETPTLLFMEFKLVTVIPI